MRTIICPALFFGLISSLVVDACQSPRPELLFARINNFLLLAILIQVHRKESSR